MRKRHATVRGAPGASCSARAVPAAGPNIDPRRCGRDRSGPARCVRRPGAGPMPLSRAGRCADPAPRFVAIVRPSLRAV